MDLLRFYKETLSLKSINSFILSIFFNIKIFGLATGQDNIIPLLIIVNFLLAFFFNGLSIFTSSRRKFLFVVYLFVLVSFLWLIGNNAISDVYYLSFLIFAIPSIFITNLKFSISKFIEYSLLLGIFLYILIPQENFIFGESGEKMYLSYLIQPFIVMSLIGIWYYRKTISILLLSICNMIFYIPLFFLVGVRGSYFCLFFFLGLILLKNKLVKRFRILLYIFFILGLVLLINFETVILSLSELMNEYDIEIYAIEKYIIMYSNEDVSNGRFLLYQNAFDGFLNSPIIGNGLGVFELLNNGLYIHNILLETLYEGGFLLFVVVFIAMWRFILFTYKNDSSEVYSFMSFLFATSVLLLFFSNTLWRVTSFWIFFGFILNSIKINNEKS